MLLFLWVRYEISLLLGSCLSSKLIGWWQRRVPPTATPIVSGELRVVVNDPLCALERDVNVNVNSPCLQEEKMSRDELHVAFAWKLG